MSPTTRAKLERNIAYHEAVRDHYAEEAKKEKETAPAPRGGTRSGEPPKPQQSSAEKLSEMHGDVVKQLADVLLADPPLTGLDEARMRHRPLRDQGAKVKPSAGVYH